MQKKISLAPGDELATAAWHLLNNVERVIKHEKSRYSFTCLIVLSHHLYFKTVLEMGQLGLYLLLRRCKLLYLTTLILKFDVSGTLLRELYTNDNQPRQNKNMTK